MKTVILSVLWNYWIADLLARFQLWTTANKIIKLCHLPIVSSLNQQSTRIHVNCHRCNRPLQRVGWLCDRCKLVINNCSVWWGPTTSIFLITLILIIYHTYFLSISYRGTSLGGGGQYLWNIKILLDHFEEISWVAGLLLYIARQWGCKFELHKHWSPQTLTNPQITFYKLDV